MHADLVRRFVALWYEPEREEELRALLAPGYVHHTPAGDLDADGLVRQLALIRGAFSDPAPAVVRLVEEGDTAAVYVRVELTHTGPFMGVAATGRRVSTAGACFCRIEDGRIAEDWDAWGLLSILRALGAG